MIAFIEGNVTFIGSDHLVVSVSGIGFKVFVPSDVKNNVELFKPIALHTYLVVREDALSLFGFLEIEQRDMFVSLIAVNGVGPRIAVNILSTLSLEMIYRAVSQEQPDLFDHVVGVGKKTAQSIILALHGKIAKTGVGGLNPIREVDADVISALTGLGYSVIEAQTAIQAIPKDAPMDLESRIRIALQQLA